MAYPDMSAYLANRIREGDGFSATDLAKLADSRDEIEGMSGWEARSWKLEILTGCDYRVPGYLRR